MCSSDLKNRRYEPIVGKVPDWPVYMLSKNRKEFIGDVTARTVERLLEGKEFRNLMDELESTALREQNRLKRNRWKVDPKDEPKFWAGIKAELVAIRSGSDEDISKPADILRRIIHRYANEIAGDFKPSHYRLARGLIKFWFARLLNGARVKKFEIGRAHV